jgi:hypothetical protein
MSYRAKNPQGLTFVEWFVKATLGAPYERIEELRQDGRALGNLRRAWRNGEDPSEYVKQ